ncbi:MAG: hypothetical protein ABI346_04600 [Candidatus Baltobacteraceae bacterium]
MDRDDPRIAAMPDVHGHAKGEHKPFAEERPIPYTARMLFLWFYHAARRGAPRFMMVADHVNFLTFEDPAAVNLVRRALKLAAAGDLYGAAESAGVEVGHASVVSEGLRQGMRFVIGAELDNDPRSRPDAQNIVDAMKPDGLVRSVHFLTIDHPEHGAAWQWPLDNPEFVGVYEALGTARVWELYEAALLEAVEKQPGHIVGHVYVPAKFGHWPEPAVLEAFEDKLLAACAERGMAIELNTRYLYNNPADAEGRSRYLDAYRRLLRKAKLRGVPVAVASDAHSPKDQGALFEIALALLDEVEINELAFPIGGRIARVALRAPREEPPPPPEPVATLPETEAEKGAAKTKRAAPPGRAARDAKRPSRALEAAPAKATLAKKAAPPKAEPVKKAATVKAASRKAAPAKPVPAKPMPAKPVPAKPVARKVTSTKAPPPKAAPARAAAKPAPAKPAPAKRPAAKAAAPKLPAARVAKVALKPARTAKKAAPAARKPAHPARKAAPPAKKKVAAASKHPVRKQAATARKATAKKAPAKKKPARKRR